MAGKIIDSWALLAFLKDAPGAEEIEKLFVSAEKNRNRQNILMSAISWGEVYGSILNDTSKEDAERFARDFKELPIQIVETLNILDVMKQAAIYRVNHKLSYAASHEAAVAKIANAELLTGNKDFMPLENEIKIKWLPNSSN